MTFGLNRINFGARAYNPTILTLWLQRENGSQPITTFKIILLAVLTPMVHLMIMQCGMMVELI